MEEDVKELQTVDGVYVEETIDESEEISTLEIPDIENPDDREYENVEIVEEGGL